MHIKSLHIYILLYCIFCSGYLSAQTQPKMIVNGVLFEVIPGIDAKSQQEFLWSIELQSVAKNIEQIVSNDEKKRLNVLFLSEKSGADWRSYWSDRMRRVYATNLTEVNDHAESFFAIVGSFPEEFRKGDRFSVQTDSSDVTSIFVNDELITQSHKPDHFEFWLRAWHTGAAMPDVFLGDLLAGGIIDDYLLTAYQQSRAPKIAVTEDEVEVETPVSDDQSESPSYPPGDIDSYAQTNQRIDERVGDQTDELVEASPVVSVILDN